MIKFVSFIMRFLDSSTIEIHCMVLYQISDIPIFLFLKKGSKHVQTAEKFPGIPDGEQPE